MRERYFDLLEQCAGDPSVRAVVLTGAGKSFSVGADTQALQKLDPDAAGRARTAPERPVHYPLSIPKPIIGAINGGCGGRLVRACALLRHSFRRGGGRR